MNLSSPYSHVALLVGFCVFTVLLWMAPVLLAGFPYAFTPSVKLAKEFAETGVLRDVLNPFFTLFLRAWLPVLDWRDATGWAAVSAITLAASLIPLWWSMKKIFSVRLAWAAVVIFALMPMHWKEAVSTGSYPLGFLCLFLGFALFLLFVPRHRFLAIGILGLCFGLALGATHAFITFLPWFVGVYAWERRTEWKKAVVELIVCGACAFAGFILPLVPNALQPELTTMERMKAFFPIEENLMPLVELYGDEYSYLFLKKEFDEKMIEKGTSGSFLERRDNENFRINNGVGSFNPFQVLFTSTWLFGNNLASLFMQEVIGGVFLWLFLLPGILSLWRTHRKTLLQLLGLWLSMELILRFGFHYARIHLMDVGWIVAILAAAGVLYVSDAIHTSMGKFQSRTITGVILLIVSLQLIQANRKIFSHEYARSGIPRAQAAAEVFDALPSTVVIAEPKNVLLFSFTDRASVLLQNDTIDILAAQGKLAEPFKYYGITHIVGYDPKRTALIRKAVPTVQEIIIEEAPSVTLTPLKKYILNVIR